MCVVCVCVYSMFSTRQPIEKQIKNQRRNMWNMCVLCVKRQTEKENERSVPNFKKNAHFSINNMKLICEFSEFD